MLLDINLTIMNVFVKHENFNMGLRLILINIIPRIKDGWHVLCTTCSLDYKYE